MMPWGYPLALDRQHLQHLKLDVSYQFNNCVVPGKQCAAATHQHFETQLAVVKSHTQSAIVQQYTSTVKTICSSWITTQQRVSARKRLQTPKNILTQNVTQKCLGNCEVTSTTLNTNDSNIYSIFTVKIAVTCNKEPRTPNNTEYWSKKKARKSLDVERQLRDDRADSESHWCVFLCARSTKAALYKRDNLIPLKFI